VLDSSLKTLLQSNALDFASPNEFELEAMGTVARELLGATKDEEDSQVSFPKELDGVYEKQEKATRALLRDAFTVSQFIPTLFIKLGSEGVFVVDRIKDKRADPSLKRNMQRFSAHAVDKIESVTGAGDSFVASVVTSLHQLAHVQPLLLGSNSEDENAVEKSFGRLDDNVFWKHLHTIVGDGQTAATLTMQTHQTVSPALAHSPQAERVRRQNKLRLTGGR